MNKIFVIPLLFVVLSAVAVPALAASPELFISIDGSSSLSPGDVAAFYFTILANGSLVNPDAVTATLYFPNNVNYITLTPTRVATGVYVVTFTVAGDADLGFYALVVSASYGGGAFKWAAVKGFQVSGLQNNLLAAIGGLSEQISSSEGNVLSAVASLSLLTTAINSSLSGQIAATDAHLGAAQSALSGSISGLGTSISNLGTSLQGAVTASQNNIVAAISSSGSSTQASVNSARDTIVSSLSGLSSGLDSAKGTIISSLNQGLSGVETYEYVIIAVGIVALILAVAAVVLLYRKK